MNPESTEIITNARAAYNSENADERITLEQLHDVYRMVAQAEAERELECNE